jgi:hypothetical protein
MSRNGSEFPQAAPAGHPATWPVQAPDSEAADSVHLLFCTDAAYLQHVAVCLTSLLVNNPGLFFNIVVRFYQPKTVILLEDGVFS